MVKAAYFADYVDEKNTLGTNLSVLGMNTGNELFISAISRLLKVDRLPRADLRDTSGKLSEYGVFVSSDLIWLRQGDEAPASLKAILDNSDRKVVIISIGVQSSRYTADFALTQDMVHTLSRVAERADIAVRGNYTAEILLKHGIKRIEVIGCPSLYQYPLYNRSFDLIAGGKAPIKSIANFRTFYEPLKPREVTMMEYFADNFQGFVEQTDFDFSRMETSAGESYEKISKWMNENRKMFFDVTRWMDYCSNFDFSMGSRFHGNVAAILSGIRALFLVVDTRTRELAEFFNVPTLYLDKFSQELKLQHYYDIADYSPFISEYHNKTSRFCTFIDKNDLSLTPDYVESLEKFKWYRIGRPWLG